MYLGCHCDPVGPLLDPLEVTLVVLVPPWGLFWSALASFGTHSGAFCIHVGLNLKFGVSFGDFFWVLVGRFWKYQEISAKSYTFSLLLLFLHYYFYFFYFYFYSSASTLQLLLLLFHFYFYSPTYTSTSTSTLLVLLLLFHFYFYSSTPTSTLPFLLLLFY